MHDVYIHMDALKSTLSLFMSIELSVLITRVVLTPFINLQRKQTLRYPYLAKFVHAIIILRLISLSYSSQIS